MKLWLSAVLLVAALCLAGCSKQDLPAAEGNPAPDFTLKDMQGRDVSLSQFRGKIVLVNFWATWCPPCREEIPSMVKLNQAMQGQPFQMLAISINDHGKKEVEPFFKANKVTLPALFDPEQKVAKRYGTTGVPETFVVDKKGVILKKVVGAMDWSAPEVLAGLGDLVKK